MPIFKVSQKAEDDLFTIGQYTEDKWGANQRNQYLDDIDKRFYQLADNPDLASPKDLNAIKKGCFGLLVNEHIIIYRKFNYGVRIVRVLAQVMDIERHP